MSVPRVQRPIASQTSAKSGLARPNRQRKMLKPFRRVANRPARELNSPPVKSGIAGLGGP